MDVRDAATAVYDAALEPARADDDVPPGYKRTEVGVIPGAWSLRPLADLSAFITKGATPTTYGFRWKDSGVLFLRSECVSEHGLDLTQSMFISQEASVAIRRSAVRGGDLLMTITGNVGRVVVYEGEVEANINQHIARIRIVSPRVDERYVFHWLSQPFVRFIYNSITTGQAYPQISLKQVRETSIAIPDTLAEQEAIAEALSDADALIETLQQLIAKQRALKQGAMQALLTGRQRLPGFSGEWQAKLLGEIAVFCKGKGLPKSALDDSGRFPCVHYGELFTRLPERVSETCSRTNWTGDAFRSLANDVLMPTSDVTPSGLAKASCIVIDGVIIGGDVLVIRTDPTVVCGTFLSCVIRNSESQILQLVTGTTVFHLYASDMRKFEFPLPPIHEQVAIITVLSDMDAEIDALEARLAKTRALKQGMMQQLLTGRIRLPLERVA